LLNCLEFQDLELICPPAGGLEFGISLGQLG